MQGLDVNLFNLIIRQALPLPAGLTFSYLQTKVNDHLACFRDDVVGLGVTCSPRDPRLAGSNPTEVDVFLQDVKILSTSSGRDFKLGVPSLRFQAR